MKDFEYYISVDFLEVKSVAMVILVRSLATKQPVELVSLEHCTDNLETDSGQVPKKTNNC